MVVVAAHAAAAVTGRRWSAYTVCGAVGTAAATGVAAAVLDRRGAPAAVAVALLAAGLLGFVAVAALTAAVLRRPVLVALHQLLAATALAVPVAVLTGVPVPVALDAVVAGLAALLVAGRIGCLLVGCCHGRPARWGIRYGPRHVAAGFPAHLAGATLIPVPAAESLLALAALAVALTGSWTGAAPGTAAAGAAVTYGTGRFVLEFWRGDGPRPS